MIFLPLLSRVGREFMINFSIWKKMGVSLTNCGSSTVRFMSTLHIVVRAQREFTISNFELSIMKRGSATSTSSSAAAFKLQKKRVLIIIEYCLQPSSCDEHRLMVATLVWKLTKCKILTYLLFQPMFETIEYGPMIGQICVQSFVQFHVQYNFSRFIFHN